MTGLTETEHLVAALEAGGVDYVTKPIKPKEVLARMGVHLQSARAQARPDAATRSTPSATPASRCAPSDGRLMWQTPLARELLQALLRHQRAGDAAAPCWTGCAATWRTPSAADRAAAAVAPSWARGA